MNRRRRRRDRTPEEIRSIVAEFRKSGLSQAAFAKQIDVHGSVLSRWIKREQARPSRPSVSPPSFVPVEITPAPRVPVEESLQLEVVLSNGRLVRVPDGFSEEALGRLVSALERC